ncbi:hypothetical protein FRC10_010835 [Ceratobasidium sp. 414]|nr:hypothetical protein FRC10_010835 [Ceratobasidium sp. 414]
MLPRQAAQPQCNNQPGPPEGQAVAQNVGGNTANNQGEAPPEGATCEEMRELEKNNQKHQLEEVTCERDQLQTAQHNKHRHARYVDKPTPKDPKYDKAGKWCVLMHMLWVSSNLFETQLDATYTEDRRYEEGKLGMQMQGELLDVLALAPFL